MSVASWIAAARPHTLFAGVLPVWLGVVVALQLGGHSIPGAWIPLPFIVILALQIAANFHNDLCDGLRGADSEGRLGQRRMVASGEISPQAMRRGVWICISIALVAAGVASLRISWALPAAGICVLAMLSYSAGKRPASHRGLGELLAMVFFGPVACVGTTYFLVFQTSPFAWILGIACGCFAVVPLALNNIRDMEQDRLVGKRTLPVRFGKRFAQAEIASMLLVPCALAWYAGASLACVSLLWSGPFILRLSKIEGSAWNREFPTAMKVYTVFALGVTCAVVFFLV